MKRHALLLTGLLGASACGSRQLEPRFVPQPALSEGMVAQNIARAELRDERAVVVGITQDPAELCAWDLKGGLLWTRPVQAKSAPLVVGDAVVLQEQTGIVVRDLASGQERVTLDADGGFLVGADGVGSALVVSIAQPAHTPGGTVAYVVGSSVRWKTTLPQAVGVPALVKDQVVVPWGTQRLTVLSATDATELARWDFHNLVLGYALVDRGDVYVGQHGLLRVAADLPDHRDGPLALAAPLKRGLPGQPMLMRDGYAAVPAPDSAEQRVQLSWRPQHGAQPGVEDDLLAFRFYRMLFGFSAQRDELSWMHVLEHDAVGAAKQSGGLFVVEDNGALSFVDLHGQVRFKRELGKALRVATVRPGAFPTDADAAAFQAPAEAAVPLHDQLLSAAKLDDNRLAPGRALAVQYLARTKEPSVTRELIALCAAHSAGRDVAQSTACDELSKRETGSQDVLEALRTRPSWLDGTDQPPVGALAQAAVRMQLKQAGPLLMNHADDPYTPVPDLVQVFIALQNLQVRAAVPQLERFVRLHHAEPAGSELAPALQGALLALGALQGQKARVPVGDVANDTLTLPVVQQTAREVLAALDRPPPAPEQPKTPAKKVKIVIDEPVLTTDPRPYALDAETVQKAFRPLNAGLVRCLDADPAQPKSARISMIINGEGKVEGALVTPTTLQGCVEPILRNAQFPATRLGRQHLVQTIHASGAKIEAAAPAPAPNTAGAKAETAPAAKIQAPGSKAKAH